MNNNYRARTCSALLSELPSTTPWHQSKYLWVVESPTWKYVDKNNLIKGKSVEESKLFFESICTVPTRTGKKQHRTTTTATRTHIPRRPSAYRRSAGTAPGLTANISNQYAFSDSPDEQLKPNQTEQSFQTKTHEGNRRCELRGGPRPPFSTRKSCTAQRGDLQFIPPPNLGSSRQPCPPPPLLSENGIPPRSSGRDTTHSGVQHATRTYCRYVRRLKKKNTKNGYERRLSLTERLQGTFFPNTVLRGRFVSVSALPPIVSRTSACRRSILHSRRLTRA